MLRSILKNDLFKNISSLALIQVGNYIIPLLIVPYISRIIGIENYGKLEYARTIVLYFTIFLDYGFNLTATREISIHRDNKAKVNKIVTNTYIAKGLLFLLSILVFAPLVSINSSLNSLSLLLWVTFLINFGNFLFPLWFFQGVEKIASIAKINFIIKLLVVASVIFFIKEKADYWKYNLFLSLAQVCIGVYSIYILLVKYHIRFIKTTLKAILNKFKEGFKVFFSTILVSCFVSYAFILLKDVGTEMDVGAYSTANKLAMTIQVLILLPFSQAFFPFIAKTASNDIFKFEKLIKKASLVIIALTVIIGIISFFFSDLIILLIFGKDYLYASDTFKILAFLPVFTILNNLFSYQGLLSLNKDKLFMNIHIVFTLFVLMISYYLVPKYGLLSVAYIRLFSEISLMSVSFFFLKKTLKKIKHDL